MGVFSSARERRVSASMSQAERSGQWTRADTRSAESRSRQMKKTIARS